MTLTEAGTMAAAREKARYDKLVADMLARLDDEQRARLDEWIATDEKVKGYVNKGKWQDVIRYFWFKNRDHDLAGALDLAAPNGLG